MTPIREKLGSRSKAVWAVFAAPEVGVRRLRFCSKTAAPVFPLITPMRSSKSPRFGETSDVPSVTVRGTVEHYSDQPDASPRAHLPPGTPIFPPHTAIGPGRQRQSHTDKWPCRSGLGGMGFDVRGT